MESLLSLYVSSYMHGHLDLTGARGRTGARGATGARGPPGDKG